MTLAKDKGKVVNRYSIYHLAEAVLVTSNGTTPVAVFSIPDGTIIDHVLAMVSVPNEDADASTIIVGDDDDPNGYIVAADAKAAAGTFYGCDPTERGAYLYDATKKGDFKKAYSAPKTLYLALSTDMLVTEKEGEYLIYIFGHRGIPLPTP